MGMDASIYLAHSKKELQGEDFWDKIPKNIDDDEKWRVIGERWYARKFWELHNELINTCFNGEYECGDWIELEKEDLDTMIHFAIHHPDYWGGFKGVESLCEIRYHWDDIKAAGLKIFYECDW